MDGSIPGMRANTEQVIGESAFLRAAPAIPARGLVKRTLESSGADVLLLDGRECRPSVTYRAIARIRAMGWEQGLVLLIDPAELSMVPVASSIGAGDFVLSTASAEEVEARLRRAAHRVETGKPRRDSGSTGIQLEWRTHQVSFEGTKVSASLRELQLLSTLLERAGEVVTSGDLARLAWGKQRGAGSVLAATYVCSLRKKLAWFGGRFGIQTVRGVGYRLVV
jgi:DNA-binding response OmpR family regulator